MTHNLRTDTAEEVAIWLALRGTEQERNDIIIHSDRREVVQKLRSASARDNIHVRATNQGRMDRKGKHGDSDGRFA